MGGFFLGEGNTAYFERKDPSESNIIQSWVMDWSLLLH